jgi:hypothetical protein
MPLSARPAVAGAKFGLRDLLTPLLFYDIAKWGMHKNFERAREAEIARSQNKGRDSSGDSVFKKMWDWYNQTSEWGKGADLSGFYQSQIGRPVTVTINNSFPGMDPSQIGAVSEELSEQVAQKVEDKMGKKSNSNIPNRRLGMPGRSSGLAWGTMQQ